RLGEPKPYSGQRSDRQQRKHVFRACLGALGTRLAKNVDVHRKRSRTRSPTISKSPERKRRNRTLTFILSQVLTGASLQLVMKVTQLMGILSIKFDGVSATFAEQFLKLEGRFQLYEKQHNDKLSDTLKQAILKANAPASIKAQIDLQTFASANDLKETMSNYIQLQTSSSSHGHWRHQ
ncbi:unnamed protein product, partial [Prorocentrum cordatum]